MTTGGWINMILSVSFVTILFAWCIYRVMRGPNNPEHLGHIEPLDENEVETR